jgi:hypothetical protein
LCLVFGKRQTSAKSIIKKKQQKNKKTLKWSVIIYWSISSILNISQSKCV